jgi:hypothetical protein
MDRIPRGTRYYRLTVDGPTDPYGVDLSSYTCSCDCGDIIDVPAVKLKNGVTQDCGCGPRLRRQNKNPFFKLWCNIRASAQRECVPIEPQWATDFKAFVYDPDVLDKPDSDCRFVRRDPALGWVSGNAQWATLQQIRDKSF